MFLPGPGVERSPGSRDHQTVFSGEAGRPAAQSGDGLVRNGGKSSHHSGGGGETEREHFEENERKMFEMYKYERPAQVFQPESLMFDTKKLVCGSLFCSVSVILLKTAIKTENSESISGRGCGTLSSSFSFFYGLQDLHE